MRYCCKFLLDSCRPDLEFIAKMIDKTAIERLEQVGAGRSDPAGRIHCRRVEWVGRLGRASARRRGCHISCGAPAVQQLPCAATQLSCMMAPPAGSPVQVANSSFKRVSYTEAIEILEGVVASGKKQFEFPVSWGIDLQSEHERYLTEEVFKQPIIVYNYPKDIKVGAWLGRPTAWRSRWLGAGTLLRRTAPPGRASGVL